MHILHIYFCILDRIYIVDIYYRYIYIIINISYLISHGPQDVVFELGSTARHVAEVSDAFERGLLVDNTKEPEAEAHIEADAAPTPRAPAPAAAPVAVPAVDPSLRAMQSQVPPF